jgi:hypothetical protein
MKTALILAFCLANFCFGQQVANVQKITLAGDSSSSGRLNAQVTILDTLAIDHTPVCGSVDFFTATFICQQLGFIVASDYGTVSDLSVPGTSTPALIRNLNCDGASFYSDCTFSQGLVPTCSLSDQAAISCLLTPGAVAGIAIGAFLFCLLLFCIPILICCCCCCGLCACITGASGGGAGSGVYHKM